YRYVLAAPAGRSFDPEFRPDLSPREMLRLGVFCGKYLTDCRKEFPKGWFVGAKLAADRRDCGLNFFAVDASQPLAEWRRKGWLPPADPRAWSRGFARSSRGGAMPDGARRQIRRWKAIRRHVRQVQRNCEPGDLLCRRRQRRALLHWAYDSRKI